MRTEPYPLHFQFAEVKKSYQLKRRYQWGLEHITRLKPVIEAINREVRTSEAPILLDLCERYGLAVDLYLCASSYWRIPTPLY